MALSGILIGAADGRPKWLEVGASMIAIDTLVHNFLHRTGMLNRFEAAHPYLAPMPVIDAVAVADVEALLARKVAKAAA
jgi:hypothetical protein